MIEYQRNFHSTSAGKPGYTIVPFASVIGCGVSVPARAYPN